MGRLELLSRYEGSASLIATMFSGNDVVISLTVSSGLSPNVVVDESRMGKTWIIAKEEVYKDRRTGRQSRESDHIMMLSGFG